MTNSKLLEQFRSFYFRNYPDDMETQISYFAVFGGLGWDIDTTKPISTLIKTIILDNYDALHEKMQGIGFHTRYFFPIPLFDFGTTL